MPIAVAKNAYGKMFDQPAAAGARLVTKPNLLYANGMVRMRCKKDPESMLCAVDDVCSSTGSEINARQS